MKSKRKTLLAIVIALFTVITAVFCFTACDKENSNGSDDEGTAEGLIFRLADGEQTVTGFEGTSTKIKIPNEYEGYPVTAIDGFAFYSCTSITSITIPDSVTYIGLHAFNGCTSLTSITIPDSVTYIGIQAFYCCTSLTSITIPDSVTVICSDIFYGCINLTSINVTRGNTVYHSAGNCLIETATKTLLVGCKNSTIPTDGSVTAIGPSAFSGCTSLTSITIPDSVTVIYGNPFMGCTNLTSISVASGNTVYHSAGNCLIETATKTLIAGSKNSIIPSDGSVTVIGSAAFYGFTNITSITFPDTVTEIGDNAFGDCPDLESIFIPNSVTFIGYGAFFDCPKFKDIYYSGTEEQWSKIVIIPQADHDGYPDYITNATIHYNSK